MNGPKALTATLVSMALFLGSSGIQVGAAAEAATTHIVAADGSAAFTSVQAAVDAASAGDTVVVRPGTYTEAVTIDTDLSLVGDGPRDEIVIAASVGPDAEDAYALMLTGASVTVADLTIATPDKATGLMATAGAPLIERVTFIGPEEATARTSAHVHRPFISMRFVGQTSPTVRESVWDGYVAVRAGASVTFEGNVVFGDTISIDGPGQSSVRDSVFHRGSISFSKGAMGFAEGNAFDGDLGQIGVDTGAVVEVRGNSFVGSADDAAIWVEGPDVSAVIASNSVAESRSGLRITRGERVTASDNIFGTTEFGITISGGDPMVESNTIESDLTGIVIVSGAAPTILGNTIDAGQRAIVVDSRSAPVISGNAVCGGEVGLFVQEGAAPQITDNEVCADGTSE